MTDDPRPAPDPGPAVPSSVGPNLPVDPDVDLIAERQQGTSRSAQGPIVLVVALGGVIGALARFQIGRWWPTAPTGFPWATLSVNVSGCLLIGVLIVLVSERFAASPLIRPFLGAGVLGGFTTFSTYTIDVHRLLTAGHAPVALGYLALTAVTAVAAAAAGVVFTRRLVGLR